jgi:demethylmenaquinone methyltransferase/2-methoxy-6-polyprenyl-1,4-benzoquinol methylase
MKKLISPVNRTKNQARANYNRLSRWYDWIAGSETRYRQLGVQTLNAQPGESVLEIGFGTGTCLLEIGKNVRKGGFVCGLDISDGMAAVARKRLKESGFAQIVSLALGDAVHSPFKDASFDAIFMSFTLELFDTPEIPLVLGECRRILNSEGRLVVVTLSKTEKPNFAERTYEWVHARMPVAVDCRPIPALALLQEAGFEIVDVISEKMWWLPVEIVLSQKLPF